MRSIPALAVLALAFSSGCTLPSSASAQAGNYEAPDERFVFFTAGKAEVLADGFFSIGYVAALLDANQALRVLVVGHADPRGKAETNRELSVKRARAVRKLLADHGIKAARVDVAAPHEESESSLSQLSRRADLLVYDPGREDAAKRVGYPVDVKKD